MANTRSVGTMERRAAVAGATSTVKLYVIATLVTAAMTIIAVVVAAAIVPDNTAVIATIVGVTSPIILSLIGGALHGMAVSIDGKLSQLVQAREDKARAEGVIEGLKENPKTNIS